MRGWIVRKADYSVADPLTLQRWMCPNCGLIFDFRDESHGDPKYIHWQDYPTGEWETEVYCPRCEISLDKHPLLPIKIVKSEIESPKTATFFVEDKMHRLAIKGIAKELKRNVIVQNVGNRNMVEKFFEYSQSRGGWEHGYFIIDLDDRVSKHSGKQRFVQLDKYCMENYFLNPEICARVFQRPVKQVRDSISKLALDKRGSITKDNRYREFFVDKFETDGDLDTFLVYSDAKPILFKLLKNNDIKLEGFVREYIAHCHSMSIMKQELPEQIIELIRKLPT